MINEIEVTAECNGHDLCVVFRTFSKNDGGQSDEISEPEYFIDGNEIKAISRTRFGATFLNMFDNYQNYEYTEKEITPQSEWD